MSGREACLNKCCSEQPRVTPAHSHTQEDARVPVSEAHTCSSTQVGRATGGAQGRLQDGRRGEHLPREGRLIKISPEEPKAPPWWGSERVSWSIRAAIAKRHKWVACHQQARISHNSRGWEDPVSGRSPCPRHHGGEAEGGQVPALGGSGSVRFCEGKGCSPHPGSGQCRFLKTPPSLSLTVQLGGHWTTSAPLG